MARSLSSGYRAMTLKAELQKHYGLKGDGKPLGDGKYKYEYDSGGRTQQGLDIQ